MPSPMLSTILVATQLLAGAAVALTPAEALQNAKQLITSGRYEDALRASREGMAAALRLPVEERKGALGALHFYAALASQAAGDSNVAREELVEFFNTSSVSATLDVKKFPREFIQLFNSVRDSAASRRAEFSFLRLYPGHDDEAIDQSETLPLVLWGASPDMQFLGTSDEKRAWARAASEEAQQEFIRTFWARRDPDPQTASNEARDEFRRRVAFADRHFGARSNFSGALSDRGRVFILLGPPHYASVKNATRRDGAFIPQASGKDSDGTVERWKYSREQLPAGMPRRDVDFVFITQQGYGTGVLQRDVFPLKVLGEAARALQRH